MGDENDLQKEWRGIIISKLDSLEVDIKGLQLEIRDLTSNSVEIANLKSWVKDLDEKNEALGSKFVSKSEFEPIKRIVFGVVQNTSEDKTKTIYQMEIVPS